MANALILCGGTGAHVGVAFLRLHTLGFALGFFRPEGPGGGRSFEFPKFYLVDQDAGDGDEREPTAWQLARRLRDRHPGRFDWLGTIGREGGPEMENVTPLPVGADQSWFRSPNNALARRFESSPWLPVLASERQRAIDYSKGMMGSPAVGSLLFKLKEYDERNKDLNRDETFGKLLAERGRLVVAGSGVGGTGASVGPTLAQILARPGSAQAQVMAVMILNWFAFEENEAQDEVREKAQLRNRVMQENANSALEFYGQSLAQKVAAVPVGMPERAYLKRRYTADVGQPICESFVHAVAALSAERHFVRDRPYGPGLYAMGAIDRGRLDGATAIPGGTLQGLANQAATLAETLETWRRVLQTPQPGRLKPALWEAIRLSAEPLQVADHLGREIAHYREQLDWLKGVLAIEAKPIPAFTREQEVRRRLFAEGRDLQIGPDPAPERIPAALLRWTAEWIREEAATRATSLGLEIPVGGATAAQWPDYNTEGIGVSIRESGDLTRIPDHNIAAVLEAFVDRRSLSSNGWPHPLAAADYFRHAIDRRDPVAMRQLELLLLGMMTRRFEVRPLAGGEAPEREISLEYLAAEYRRLGYEGVAAYGLFDPQRGGLLLGFTSPHTLLAPVPFMDDKADNRIWQELWTSLAGASDGAPWAHAEAPASWGDREISIRQIRTWIEDEKQRLRGNAPAWTRAFEGTAATGPSPLYGTGPRVRVYWSAASTGDRPIVEVDLPSPDTDSLWVPEAGTPDLDTSEMFVAVPDLERVERDGSELYAAVRFTKPDSTDQTLGLWDDHLNYLREQGKIRRWSRTAHGEILVAIERNGALTTSTLANSEVLSRASIEVIRCAPFLQDPVPGSETPKGAVRCPDLPLKSDYLDLVRSPSGEALGDMLRRGDDLRPLLRRPDQRRDNLGRLAIRWSVPLRGRRDPMSFEIRLEGKEGKSFEPDQRAHFLVWPKFRDRAARWRAYYTYDSCSYPRWSCDVVWLGAGGALRRSAATGRPPSLGPVEYRTGAKPAHTGGPPVAFSLRNLDTQQEMGLYLVPLEPLPDVNVEIKAAIDFGTAHSAAAFSIANETARALYFAAELTSDRRSSSLTLHLSEDNAHIQDNWQQGGLLASAAWMPTYRSSLGQASLPSELLLVAPIQEMKARSIADWVPLADFTIPPLDVSRTDLADCLLSDFKWDASSEFFRGRESELRGHYLGLLLELTLADLVAHQLHGLPTKPIHLTFTYPLRASPGQLKALRASIDQVLERTRTSLGVDPILQDGVGLYDESRAARLTTENFGEVCVVGDLGGGTLDLFIAANQGNRSGRAPLREVADSVRLGGNILLRQIAENPTEYLPAEGGWFGDRDGHRMGPRDTEIFLRAWMRSKGSIELWGDDAADRPELPALRLTGFSRPGQAEPARRLLDRYFHLIVEYMARNLAAFLIREWYPNVPSPDCERLKITVQLRGNGWRLRYGERHRTEATAKVQDLVRRRLETLWPLIPNNSYPAPSAADNWKSAQDFKAGDPKTDPIKSVVGLSMEPDEVGKLWYTHVLTDLDVHRDNGEFLAIPWTERVPFYTAGSRHLQIEKLSPPIVLSNPLADRKVEIRDLEAVLQGSINTALQGEQGMIVDQVDFRAPIAPLVWEAVFKSGRFWPDTREQ